MSLWDWFSSGQPENNLSSALAKLPPLLVGFSKAQVDAPAAIDTVAAIFPLLPKYVTDQRQRERLIKYFSDLITDIQTRKALNIRAVCEYVTLLKSAVDNQPQQLPMPPTRRGWQCTPPPVEATGRVTGILERLNSDTETHFLQEIQRWFRQRYNILASDSRGVSILGILLAAFAIEARKQANADEQSVNVYIRLIALTRSLGGIPYGVLKGNSVTLLTNIQRDLNSLELPWAKDASQALAKLLNDGINSVKQRTQSELAASVSQGKNVLALSALFSPKAKANTTLAKRGSLWRRIQATAKSYAGRAVVKHSYRLMPAPGHNFLVGSKFQGWSAALLQSVPQKKCDGIKDAKRDTMKLKGSQFCTENTEQEITGKIQRWLARNRVGVGDKKLQKACVDYIAHAGGTETSSLPVTLFTECEPAIQDQPKAAVHIAGSKTDKRMMEWSVEYGVLTCTIVGVFFKLYYDEKGVMKKMASYNGRLLPVAAESATSQPVVTLFCTVELRPMSVHGVTWLEPHAKGLEYQIHVDNLKLNLAEKLDLVRGNKLFVDDRMMSEQPVTSQQPVI